MRSIINFLKEEKLMFIFWTSFIFLYSINLLRFPIFQDEGEFLFLVEKIIQSPAHNFFVSLNQGIMPVYIWAIYFVSKITSDTLLAGRLVNVICASTMFPLFILFGSLYKLPKRFANYCSFIFFFSPLVLLLIRISLLDMSVMVFVSWYLYFAASYFKKKQVKYLVFHLVFFLLAFFTKATAVFGIPPIVFLVLSSLQKDRITKEVKFLTVSYLIIGILMFFFIKFFGRYFIFDSGLSLIFNLNRNQIFLKIKSNIWLLFHWLKVYYWPYILLIILGLFVIRNINNRQLVFLLVFWGAFSLISIVILNRYFYPRHVLMVVIPLIAIVSLILSKFNSSTALLLATLLVLGNLNLFKDILLHPEDSHIALEDNFQYFEDFTSGKNISVISRKIREVAGNKKIVLWLDGTWVMEYGLRREFKNADNIIFKSYGLNLESVKTDISRVEKINSYPNYLLVNRTQPVTNSQLKLIMDFPVSFRLSQKLYLLN
jgi:hypothetical protein